MVLSSLQSQDNEMSVLSFFLFLCFDSQNLTFLLFCLLKESLLSSAWYYGKCCLYRKTFSLTFYIFLVLRLWIFGNLIIKRLFFYFKTQANEFQMNGHKILMGNMIKDSLALFFLWILLLCNLNKLEHKVRNSGL